MSNKLAKVKSLYLRKHAENPINWWYWCEEAIQTAKEQKYSAEHDGRVQ